LSSSELWPIEWATTVNGGPKDVNTGVYVVAGRDLRRFVAARLDQVQTADPTQHPIVSAVAEETDPKEQAFLGGAALMSFIGPRAWGEAGSDEELLLFAVLAVYTMRDDEPWEGYESRVQRAFEFMHEIGEVEAARRLRQEIVDKDKDDELQAITNLLRGTSHKTLLRSQLTSRKWPRQRAEPCGLQPFSILTGQPPSGRPSAS